MTRLQLERATTARGPQQACRSAGTPALSARPATHSRRRQIATAPARFCHAAGRWLQTVARPLTLAAALAAAPGFAPAQSQSVTVIGNDRGGLVGERARIVDALRANDQRIEIRGDLCYSSCTMYLGAGNVCVSPDTTFGFHGPSRNGTPLPPDSFDHWSRVMARYYNEPLRQWFMSQARYATNDPVKLSGRQIITLGYQPC